MYNTSLKYKKFDQLVDEVMIDFNMFALEKMIEPHQLIKIAKLISAQLGLKIQMTKEVILEVEKGRVRLPSDFKVANYGLLCGNYEVTTIPVQGTTIEERPFSYKDFNPVLNSCDGNDGLCPKCNIVRATCGCGTPTCPPVTIPAYNPLVPYGDYCVQPRVFMNCKNEAFELVHLLNTETRTYKFMLPLKFLQSSQGITCECPNLYVKSADEVYIKNDWLYCNFQCGKVYLNYQGMMEDADGNLLVLDHDIINELYEYALKERILENLIMQGEDVQQRYQLVAAKLEVARYNAMSIATMPDFNVLKKTWEVNRKAQYHKYYNMFSSCGWNSGPPYFNRTLIG